VVDSELIVGWAAAVAATSREKKTLLKLLGIRGMTFSLRMVVRPDLYGGHMLTTVSVTAVTYRCDASALQA
jgi:hypothetical protein